MKLRTARARLALLRNGRSGLTLAGPRSTILLATEFIEIRREWTTSNLPEQDPGASANATAPPA